MKKTLILAISTALLPLAHADNHGEKAKTQKENKDTDGWVSLFDGKTLKGWNQKNGTATFDVRDDVIVGITKKGSPNSFLCTDKEYGDFELEFDVWVDSRLNSGVQLRSQSKPEIMKGRVTGPQVEIEATDIRGGGEAGYIYGEGRTTGRGWLVPNEDRKPHKHFKDGKWNHYRIVCKGPRIQTWINGNPICDISDDPIYKTHSKGFIGLQVHGVGKSGTFFVTWKNIRIKELK
ncbi:MAG: DUF1080 domain-containing protein [Akkermansiaceae bacterium]